MDNQQGIDNVTGIEWSWLAGMMNGDGCFSLKLRKRDKRWKCDVSITLTQCDPCIIERASDILIRGIGCNPPIQEYAPTGTGVNTKYNLRITKMSLIAAFIEKVHPFMCGVKQAKAKLLLRYVQNRIEHNGEYRKIHKLTDDHVALKTAEEFYVLSGSKVPKEIVKTLRDYPKGVGPSGPKRTAPRGEDIVQSCARA